MILSLRGREPTEIKTLFNPLCRRFFLAQLDNCQFGGRQVCARTRHRLHNQKDNKDVALAVIGRMKVRDGGDDRHPTRDAGDCELSEGDVKSWHRSVVDTEYAESQ